MKFDQNFGFVWIGMVGRGYVVNMGRGYVMNVGRGYVIHNSQSVTKVDIELLGQLKTSKLVYPCICMIPNNSSGNLKLKTPSSH